MLVIANYSLEEKLKLNLIMIQKLNQHKLLQIKINLLIFSIETRNRTSF